MVRIDGNKIGEIKDYYDEQAKREIAKAINDPDTEELKDDDIQAIKNKWKFQANEHISVLFTLGPKKLHKLGFTLDPNGWRTGYTKAPIENRTKPRRAKNKLARKTRREQRRK